MGRKYNTTLDSHFGFCAAMYDGEEVGAKITVGEAPSYLIDRHVEKKSYTADTGEGVG